MTQTLFKKEFLGKLKDKGERETRTLKHIEASDTYGYSKHQHSHSSGQSNKVLFTLISRTRDMMSPFKKQLQNIIVKKKQSQKRQHKHQNQIWPRFCNYQTTTVTTKLELISHWIECKKNQLICYTTNEQLLFVIENNTIQNSTPKNKILRDKSIQNLYEEIKTDERSGKIVYVSGLGDPILLRCKFLPA